MAARAKTGTRVTTGAGLMTIGADGELVPSELNMNPQAEFDPGNIGEDIQSDDIALGEVLAQLGETENDAKVYVYRVDDKTKKDSYMYMTNPADFATGGLDEIAKRYGGGDYRIRVYANGRVLTHKRVSILEPRTNEATTAGVGDTRSILLTLQQAQQQQQENMMRGFTMLAEAMRQNAPVAPSRTDMLNEMVMYKSLFGGNEQKPGMETMIEILKQGMEMGKMASGAEPSALDALMKGVETFGPVLMETVRGQAMQQAQQTSQMPVQALPAPMPNPIHQSAPQTEREPDMGIRDMMLKQAITFLVSNAKKDNDPMTYANMVIDQMDEAELSQFMTRADWLDFLAIYNAEVKQPLITKWFEELKECIQDVLTQAAEADTKPELTPETGNATSIISATASNGNASGNT